MKHVEYVSQLFWYKLNRLLFLVQTYIEILELISEFEILI